MTTTIDWASLMNPGPHYVTYDEIAGAFPKCVAKEPDLLTSDQIDSRMAELEEVLFETLRPFSEIGDAKRYRAWERMKDVAEQAKKVNQKEKQCTLIP